MLRTGGKRLGKKHEMVNYVCSHSLYKLYQYHMKVINEMKRRGYKNNLCGEIHCTAEKSKGNQPVNV
ncbi:pyrimidine dimer DNA glycosylase/endonuclease V [Virgibacillus alimentarius]|uniref:pyrimidine dimer DNA glycosylase/endonuclease V n=2 Tax=Virgibacillus alimentarius TaxID=698769 RepID=UPI000B0A2928